MTLLAKIAMFDLQRYPLNLDLIELWKIKSFFLTRKLFNHDIFSVASKRQESVRGFFKETTKESKPFKETKNWKSNSYLIRQSF